VADPVPVPGKTPLLPRIALAALALAALFALFRLLPVASWIEALKAYGRAQGAAGAVVFGLVYVGASLVPGGPAALLTLAAGAVYGVVAGTALVSVSSVAAATLAFLLARGALRERVLRMAGENAKFAGLNRAIGREGAKIVVLVRLSPAFPFTIVNYLFGLTPVPLPAYVLSSWIAMLPGTLAYVYFGSALGAVSGEATPLEKGIRVALGVAAVVATALIARIAAKAIKSASADGAEIPPAPGPEGVS
jgi:uncharacterized membrane protein YdjX (TVP38/TMEM64 family)